MQPRELRWLFATVLLAFGTSACSLKSIGDKFNGPYHRLTGGTAVYLTIQRRATDCMVGHWRACVHHYNDRIPCAEKTLQLSRGIIEQALTGAAKFAWDHQLNKAWKLDEAADFANAANEAWQATRSCLQVRYTSGEDWRITLDGGDCHSGDPVQIRDEHGRVIGTCPYTR